MVQSLLKLTLVGVLCLSCCQAKPAEEEKNTEVVQDAAKVAEGSAAASATQKTGEGVQESEDKPELYGEFPEEKIKVSLTGCKIPGSVKDKCYGFPYQNSEGGIDYMPFPFGYGSSFLPPLYGPNASMPWGCYPYPTMPCNYTPFFSYPNFNFYPAFHPMMPINFSNISMGYGFAPHPFAACGPYGINRTFIEQSLKNPKVFEKLKNCSYC